jgi:hypothetical protein
VSRAAKPIGIDSPTKATDAKRWALAAVSLAIPAGAGEAAEATVAVTFPRFLLRSASEHRESSYRSLFRMRAG